MSWITALKSHVQIQNERFVNTYRRQSCIRETEEQCLRRKKDQLTKRKAKIVKSIVDGQIVSSYELNGIRTVDYALHFQHLIKQNNSFYLEEKIEQRRAVFDGDIMIDDYCPFDEKQLMEQERNSMERFIEPMEVRYSYSRIEAVRYAERWWNDYNPQYKKFENNCTNFISQCLHAGGAPMTGISNRSKGWWYKNNNWSYSWAVAHSFRWYLSGATTGLRAEEVQKPEQLMNGDVICYDFDGDRRWQHTTIVVAKDANGMPLVNAQTTNSRMRYWEYTDSTAWTPNIKYKFFHIID